MSHTKHNHSKDGFHTDKFYNINIISKICLNQSIVMSLQYEAVIFDDDASWVVKNEIYILPTPCAFCRRPRYIIPQPRRGMDNDLIRSEPKNVIIILRL